MPITRRHLAMLGIAVGAVILWLAADRLIMTDKKRIRRAIGQMASAVEKGDADGVFVHVSPLYVDEVHSYAKFRAMAELFLAQHEDVSINIREVSVMVNGSTAVAQVRVIVSQSGQGGSVSVWQLDFEREQDGRWLVTTLTPLRFNTQDVVGWKGFYVNRWD